MTTVTADDLAADPAGWLRRVEAGESLHIVRDGRLLAWVTPVPAPEPLPPRPADLPPLGSGLRPFGLCKGEFVVPDDFDAPMSEDDLKLWYGE